jgi:hypothetical protein
MINSIGSGMQIPSMQMNQQSMTTEQKDKVQEILDKYSTDSLSGDDASSIVESFAELGVPPSQELEQLMADNGFDAKSVGDMAGANGTQMPPPPPQGDVTNSNEMVSFLEELLESFDEQLSDDDKETILSAVQEKFDMNDNDSLISVKA